ncbi:MAG TPA: DUF2934 domain-containing protein [Stellaceae bacterium]|nr:DUF2934 domain-containing protein [Stellaceae bacterium]
MELREERIRERAYQIWEREGKPHGRDAEHWQQAVSEVDAEVAATAGAGVGETRTEEPARPAASPSPTRRSRAVPRREPGEKRR